MRTPKEKVQMCNLQTLATTFEDGSRRKSRLGEQEHLIKPYKTI
jgi:hypothetical protein